MTFDPRGISGLVGYAVDPASLTGVSCPSARRCTAIDVHGREVTFNPRRAHHPHLGKIAHRRLLGIACPSRTRCVALTRTDELAFDPRATSPKPTRTKLGALTAVSCPSRRECVAVDARGYAITSNPDGERSAPNRIDTHPLTAISCPTRTFCVAGDRAGQTIEGNPQQGGRWTIDALAGASALRAIDCPTSRLCVAVDSAGHIFTGRG